MKFTTQVTDKNIHGVKGITVIELEIKFREIRQGFPDDDSQNH